MALHRDLMQNVLTDTTLKQGQVGENRVPRAPYPIPVSFTHTHIQRMVAEEVACATKPDHKQACPQSFEDSLADMVEVEYHAICAGSKKASYCFMKAARRK